MITMKLLSSKPVAFAAAIVECTWRRVWWKYLVCWAEMREAIVWAVVWWVASTLLSDGANLVIQVIRSLEALKVRLTKFLCQLGRIAVWKVGLEIHLTDISSNMGDSAIFNVIKVGESNWQSNCTTNYHNWLPQAVGRQQFFFPLPYLVSGVPRMVQMTSWK